MSLLQSAKLNGHNPYAYLKDVLGRLPTQKNNAINELLPHNWKPAVIDSPDAYSQPPLSSSFPTLASRNITPAITGDKTGAKQRFWRLEEKHLKNREKCNRLKYI